jgi:hypothetical protein
LLAQPLVGPSLQRLFSKGLVEQDIVELANFLFERSNVIDGGSSTNADKQSLMSGLEKYGGGVKTIIQKLNQQTDELRNQIYQLQRQKQDLKEQNQKMLSILAYSKPLVEFLDGSAHSFSNDEDNITPLTLIACILYILYLRYVGVEKLAEDDLNKLFVTAADAARGEAVSIPDLKLAIGKDLRALIDKLDSKSQPNEDISLINNQQNKQ